MNDYRTRTKVNTAVLIREQIGNLSPGDDPAEPAREGLLEKLLTIITGRKGRP